LWMVPCWAVGVGLAIVGAVVADPTLPTAVPAGQAGQMGTPGEAHVLHSPVHTWQQTGTRKVCVNFSGPDEFRHTTFVLVNTVIADWLSDSCPAIRHGDRRFKLGQGFHSGTERDEIAAVPRGVGPRRGRVARRADNPLAERASQLRRKVST